MHRPGRRHCGHRPDDRAETAGALDGIRFLHYFFVSIVIVNMDLPHIPWWIEGGVVGLALTIPMPIQVGHADRKPLPVIAANAVVLGTLVGIAGHLLR